MDQHPLAALLAAWDAAYGPVPEQAATDATAAFDDLDAYGERSTDPR
ncbi:hypothetical protein GHK86_09060 [Acidimicrobiaceae bacterium USS-CC1]|uniref:Uncharacterized protein n=1 Tax=Acidiferrimicrobium australe TaxID=2664430 RepID=A0ABW9QTC1_9ACTN|nr:hypothetical protein [Acidiferrimicrobium australe]